MTPAGGVRRIMRRHGAAARLCRAAAPRPGVSSTALPPSPPCGRRHAARDRSAAASYWRGNRPFSASPRRPCAPDRCRARWWPWRVDRDAADDLVVEPPFFRTGCACRCRSSRRTRWRSAPSAASATCALTPNQLAMRVSKRAVGVDHLVDRAGLHAAPAGRAARIGEAIARAALDVRLPHLVAVEHHLVAERNGVAGAFARAFQAVAAESLQAEIDRPVGLRAESRWSAPPT